MFETIIPTLPTRELDFLTNKEEIILKLSQILTDIVKAIPDKQVGIAFSGGIDSTLLALLAQKLKKCKLYTAGMQNAKDLEQATTTALQMKWPLKAKVISKQEAITIFKEVIPILQKANVPLTPTNIGVGAVMYATLKMAKEDNVTIILDGGGGDEIFGGFQRHTKYGEDFSPKAMQQAMINDIRSFEERDLYRDDAIAKAIGINFASPFMNKELVSYAMKIDPTLKITKEQNKIIFRETAQALGLPREIAQRKKIACQYGSKFDWFLEKLAKEKKVKYKQDVIELLANESKETRLKRQ